MNTVWGLSDSKQQLEGRWVKVRGTRSSTIRKTFLLGEKIEKVRCLLEPWQREERRKEKIRVLGK